MRSICIFAGANPGIKPEYQQKAALLGRLLAEQDIRLVYGGSRNGLMGIAANEALAYGGEVVGIMPTGLFKAEIVHRELTELVEVNGMHERKAKMAEYADAFIALPGGIGTFEELFEVLCWAQIGLHGKPVGLLNTLGYYEPLMGLIRHCITEGFASHSNLEAIHIADEPEDLLSQMRHHSLLIPEKKWS
ncbi:TIGR00730 family Rossman fold protein [Paenibacillus sp. CAA11]|uniref:LOG family protein n=1 Tax=Paenibacillus sp. CAA11 TaxID=1532905 RepID=UPI000D35F2C7|nr:TIGR00730 family Rossman fold protein [Paenibacillus sp. CAA11]AWB45228.1 TIGR00730 family Rossman fold protein [Paenibacillus sp. CAA11]